MTVKYSYTPLNEAYWFQEGPGVRNTQFKNEGIKLLNGANILKSGYLDLNKTTRYLSEKEVEEKYKHFLCDVGDLVIASSGISFDSDGLLRTRGAFISQEHLPLCMNTSTIRFKSVNQNSLQYLKHWLQSYEFRRQISRYVTGSAQQNFGPTHLKKIKIRLLPLIEQNRIAELLDIADRTMYLRESAIGKLDQLAQSIFVDTFKSGNWASKNLKQLGKVKTGRTPPSIKTGMFGKDLPFITPGDLESNVQPKRFLSKEGVAKSVVVKKGSALVCCIGATIGKMDKAKTESAFNQQLNAVEWSDEINDVYGIYALRNIKNKIINSGSITTMPILKKSLFEKLEIKVPPISLQNQFRLNIEAVEAVKKKYKFQLQKIKIMKESLQNHSLVMN
jgi:type I restriction enzyme S subunit